MCAYGNLPAVVVDIGFSLVAAAVHCFPVVADGQGQGIRHRFPLHQLEHKRIHHLPDDDPCFLVRVRTRKHLPFTDAVERRAVLLDVPDGAGFDAKCVVDQDLRVNAEGLVNGFDLVLVKIRADNRAAVGDVIGKAEAAAEHHKGEYK